MLALSRLSSTSTTWGMRQEPSAPHVLNLQDASSVPTQPVLTPPFHSFATPPANNRTKRLFTVTATVTKGFLPPHAFSESLSFCPCGRQHKPCFASLQHLNLSISVLLYFFEIYQRANIVSILNSLLFILNFVFVRVQHGL